MYYNFTKKKKLHLCANPPFGATVAATAEQCCTFIRGSCVRIFPVDPTRAAATSHEPIITDLLVGAAAARPPCLELSPHEKTPWPPCRSGSNGATVQR